MGDKEVSSPPSPVPRSWLSVWPGRWIKPSPWKGCSWHIKSRLGRRVLPQLPGPPNPFQLNKKLFNAFHKSNQTSPSRSLLHLMQPCSLMPRTMPGQLKNHDLDSKNNEEDFFFFFYNQTWTRCMFCFFAQRRLEELCSLLSFSWSLDYSHTGYAEILKQAGKRGFEHAKHTALWEWIKHVTAFKFLRASQTNVTPDGQRGSLCRIQK